jgi:predicted lactoylglutathione lyase
MVRTIFVSLPVADVARSTAFYEALGFVKDPNFSAGHASALRWSDTITFMVSDKAFFSTLTPKPIADPRAGAQLLIALSMDSRAEVDAICEKAAAAGGTTDASPPEDLGFMYSRDFADPDGHGFGPFFMDPTAAPASAPEAEPAA